MADEVDCFVCRHIGREQREQSIVRLIDGESMSIVGARLGVPKTCVSSWFACWKYREGMWQGEPLTEAELARGWTVKVTTYAGSDWKEPWEIRRVITKRRAQKPMPWRSFVTKVTNDKPLSVDEIQKLYKALPQQDQARFAPVFDLILESIDHRTNAVLKKRRALEALSVELQESA